jgi:hypothetical protein
MKENNLRLHFDDTSVSASFPRNDWRFIANDSQNGGDSYLGIEDTTGGRIPFRVEAGAGNHALFVESTGDVGFGTNNPVVRAHMSDGDTPTLRLEQNGSSGWTPQVWDVAGNETNFFVRDVTHGSKLPFRIRPDAPSNALEIEADGNIDIAKTVEIGSGADAIALTIPDNGTNYPAVKIGESFISSGIGYAQWSNNNYWNGSAWSPNNKDQVGALLQMANDRFRFWSTAAGTGVPVFTNTANLDAAGNLEIRGAYNMISDKNRKTGIEAVDTGSVLDRLAAMPVHSWSYKHEDTVRHMGPMAQDFWGAFGLGHGDTTLSPADTAGVALASAQELHKRLEAKEDRIADLEKNNEALEARLARLEALLEKQSVETAAH